ncbi:hypothetical protein Hokovirus_3_86 [Hokovirus HKV1]|uniref:Uncharacterized protein n=1 Tax=Hokovirus HKV1 TaxID=1977638 RepID=A0A1V0SGH7_9VIRU|nr:hypothetical protein Hokovirus_3_86 [Hokovirus HKV1]
MRKACPSFANGEFNNNNIQGSYIELNGLQGLSKTNNYGMNNYDRTFTPNKTLLDPINTTNKGELLHNNVNTDVLNENTIEYRINIDSYDRNINNYPSPFDFVVNFTNGNIKDSANIGLTLNNIQYIRIETVIMPMFITTKCNNNKNCQIFKDNDSYNDGCNEFHQRNLLTERFIIMEIQELENEQMQTFSTADNRQSFPRGAYCSIVPDTKMLGWYSGICFNGNKFYKKNNLQQLKRLTIKFYDSYGVPLFYDNITIDNKKLKDPNYIHPKDKNIQVYITMAVGVNIPGITTKPTWPK